ncbi:hypothetical protein GCM10017673_57120 [Streptosporangium violaceochromogenes]|nr:hypothetical protein GCM10017673_57120 [Streptosporangium violaceochromogenes]
MTLCWAGNGGGETMSGQRPAPAGVDPNTPGAARGRDDFPGGPGPVTAPERRPRVTGKIGPGTTRVLTGAGRNP